MALITYFSTEDGYRRLLEQPRDVVPRADGDPAIRPEEAGPGHHALFAEYRQDLRTAYGEAAPWWEATIEAQERLGLPQDEAIEAAFTKRAAGAAAHPRVVWIVRTYWLACDRLNRDGATPPVDPETLLLKWLADLDETELLRLVCCMPYWPIGLDADGRWC